MPAMKAWTYSDGGYPTTLKPSTLRAPATLSSSSHIILRPHAVSLNPVDIQLMNLPHNTSTELKIAGRDFSEKVIAAGSDSGLSVGDEIMGIQMGTPRVGFLAEVVALDVKIGSGATIIKKPAGIDWVKAASLPCVWLTAKTSVEKCVAFMPNKFDAKANKLVVLGGSSSIGIYTIKLAKKKGRTVLASCSGKNIEFVKSLGVGEVVDYTTSSDAVVSKVRAFQPNAIIDCVGGTETIGLAKQYVTIVGDKTSRATMGGSALYRTHPRMLLRWFLGYVGLSNSHECIVLDSNVNYLTEVNHLSADDIVIDSIFSFDKAKEAFERLDTGRARGKVVVEMTA